MNNSAIIELMNDADDLDLILIHIFNEPYQFMKKNIRYDITKDGNTLAIQTLHNKRVYLLNIHSIKSVSTLSKDEYQWDYSHINGVMAE